MNEENIVAHNPDDLARLLVKRMNEGDSTGAAALYEEGAVLSVGPDNQVAIGRDAIRIFYSELAAKHTKFEVGKQHPALICGDVALTSTRLSAGTVTAEVARRQPDGSWLWMIDQPALATRE